MKYLLWRFFCFGAFVSTNAVNRTQFVIDYDAWWGPTDQDNPNDTAIEEFTIEFDDDMITDLRDRLSRYRKPAPSLEGDKNGYGFNVDCLDGLIKYWGEEYDFSAQAQYLNQYQHYRTKIAGIYVHFMWIKQTVTTKKVIPVLLMHGWPGSIREFYDVIPLLTADCDDKDYVLELIVVSIPGFGYSDGAVRPGLGGNEIAVVFHKLMVRLGYTAYVIHGGDWGAFIGSIMATLYPEYVLGYHTNFAFPFTWKAIAMMGIGEYLPELVVNNTLASRIYPLADALSWAMLVTGYMHYQSTKPDTLGIGLTDSPVGFMAHVFSMMSSVTRRSNNDTDCALLETYYTREQLFDNLMLYWAPNKITTASRMYAESFNKKTFTSKILEEPTEVPTWVIQAPNEMAYFSPVMLKTKWSNLVGVTVLEEGGHFLALEMPDVLANDILKAIQEFIWWHEDECGN